MQDCVRINGPSLPEQRLPNTLSISIRGLDSSQALVQMADTLVSAIEKGARATKSRVANWTVWPGCTEILAYHSQIPIHCQY